MFEIVQFEDGEYGIRNQMTNQILASHGEILSFPTPERAEKRARKIAKRLNRTIHKLQKNRKEMS